ncbi:MAG: chemotaxis protein CheC [Deltaproteobacteria bacterium]|nr:MAG: chemotaxis protein CheC [Deltaproteobacteria bacterium]
MNVAPHTARASELDRLRELTNIGAGHAATALARLIGQTIWMRVPNAEALGSGVTPGSRGGWAQWPTGVFVDIRGGVGGVAGLLLSASSRDLLVDRLLRRRDAEPSDIEVESALCEVGNIVLSSLVSAIADTLGVIVMPSAPMLASSDADSLFESVVGERSAGLAGLCIQSELIDDAGALRALLIWAPDRHGAASPAEATAPPV